MLVIKDLSKLKEYGFKKNGCHNHCGRDIWVLNVYEGEGNEVTLIVNPLQLTETENEIVCVLNVEIEEKELRSMEHGYDVELILPLEVIYQMIADGVIEQTSMKKAVA